jgi:hypothetical protein
LGNKHSKSDLDRARDELMSHVVRCDVLKAGMDDRVEWLNDTMDFMAERYPGLGELQLAQLEMIGKQFLRPAIPHGAGKNAVTLDRTAARAAEAEAAEAVEGAEAEVAEPETTEIVDAADTPAVAEVA